MESINRILNDKKFIKERLYFVLAPSDDVIRTKEARLKGIKMIPELSINLDWENKVLNEKSVLVFIDSMTNTLYKMKVSSFDEMMCRFLVSMNNEVKSRGLSSKYVFRLDTQSIVFNNYKVKSRNEFIEKYIFQINPKIKGVELDNLCKYIKAKYLYYCPQDPEINMEQYLGIENFIHSRCKVTMNEIEDRCIEYYHKYYDESYKNYLEYYAHDVKIDCLLTSMNRFSGNYRLTKNTYDYDINNPKKSLCLELNMAMGYNENLQYILSNKDEIWYCIKTILKYHPSSRRYINKLVLRNTTLTRSNILMITFDIV